MHQCNLNTMRSVVSPLVCVAFAGLVARPIARSSGEAASNAGKQNEKSMEIGQMHGPFVGSRDCKWLRHIST